MKPRMINIIDYEMFDVMRDDIKLYIQLVFIYMWHALGYSSILRTVDPQLYSKKGMHEPRFISWHLYQTS